MSFKCSWKSVLVQRGHLYSVEYIEEQAWGEGEWILTASQPVRVRRLEPLTGSQRTEGRSTESHQTAQNTQLKDMSTHTI